MPIATVPKVVAERLQLGKRQAEPLEDENDIEWTGGISIGTPGKTFLIDFDSEWSCVQVNLSLIASHEAGSSDLWVPGSNCKSSGCSTKTTYNPDASSTSKSQNGTFIIQYGDRSTVLGPIYSDTGQFQDLHCVT
jgi:cathepsin D